MRRKGRRRHGKERSRRRTNRLTTVWIQAGRSRSDSGRSSAGAALSLPASAQEAPVYRDSGALRELAQGIVDWKKTDNGSSPEEPLINESFLELAGTTPGDWYPIGMSRLGMEDDYAGYLAVIREDVRERYREPGKLHSAKATEWHRISWPFWRRGAIPPTWARMTRGTGST